MNDERKDEIGKLFLLKRETSIEELKNLEIQEIIFLIYSAKHFKDKKEFIAENFDEKISLFMEILIHKIKYAEKLYIAYDRATNYPYIDDSDRLWIFSKEEYANNAKDYFMQQLIMLEMKKINTEEIMKTFVDLHRLGIKNIIVDYGEYNTEIDRDSILEPFDFMDIPKINIPVLNPELQHAIICFFQKLDSGNNYEAKKMDLHQLEDKMLEQIINAKYLIPMQIKEKEDFTPDKQGIITLKKGNTIQVANSISSDKKHWLPAFTDWEEFKKAYDENIWSANISTYDDLLVLSESIEGIVINCKGIPVNITETNKKMINKYREEKMK